jgi:hypothetical protein
LELVLASARALVLASARALVLASARALVSLLRASAWVSP